MRFVTLLLASSIAVAAHAAPAPVPADADAAYKDMQATLGSVPGFFKAYPANAIAPAWEFFKTLEANPSTAIPPKYKELIALGVAAQIPCHYCVYAHTEFAKLNGATDDEIKHALAEAALTRLWSTVLNGLQQDETAFKAELTKAVDFMKKMMASNTPPPAPMAVTDAKSAFADMERSMGTIPTFMKTLPEPLVPSAWKQMKIVEMSEGPVPPKYISLLSLAIASQIPCRYCVLADKEFASVGGASEAEMREAILMAGHTRHWSTYLNGSQYEESKFRRDIDTVVSAMKKKSAKPKA